MLRMQWWVGGGLVTKSYPTLVTPRTIACQAPFSIKFSSQEYWSRLPFPSPGDLPGPGIKPRSPILQGDAVGGSKFNHFVRDEVSFLFYLVFGHTSWHTVS